MLSVLSMNCEVGGSNLGHDGCEIFVFSNFRLFHLAGKFFLNYQAAPVFYVIIVFVAFLFGKRKYKMLQVGK